MAGWTASERFEAGSIAGTVHEWVGRVLRAWVDAVGDYPAGSESCSVLSGSVVVMERVSV
jgi:hypothetical protein